MKGKLTWRISFAIVCILCIDNFLTSCNRYYKPEATSIQSADQAASIIIANQPEKYFIVHNGAQNYEMEKIMVDQTKQSVDFIPKKVRLDHTTYLYEKNGKYRYKDVSVLYEVHIYLIKPVTLDTNFMASIPLTDIERIVVIQHDKSRTTTSYVLGGIGITLAAIIVAGAVVAATKSSCPFVSTYDGKSYETQGELFGGALYPSLEREDFIPLQIDPVNGVYTIKISNELKERQYINFANLIVAEHPVGKKVIYDPSGHPLMIGEATVPENAILNDKYDETSKLISEDRQFCSFDDTSQVNPVNDLVISFKKPPGAVSAKLHMKLKNTYWLDYLYGEFSQSFGDYYNEWVKKQNEIPASQHIQWSEDQSIPLRISVKTSAGWKELTKLKTIGPLTNRDVVIPVDLTLSQDEMIKVKLSTGFMFWELDYAGMDFSIDQPVNIITLSPNTAIDEKGKDLITNVFLKDKDYIYQPDIGNIAILTYPFNKKPAAGNVYSVILQTSGYYQPIREYTGKPDLAYLGKFRQPGYFTAYSREKYFEIKNSQPVIVMNK